MLEANGCAFPASAEKRLEEPGSSRLCRSSRAPRAGGGSEVDRAPSGRSGVLQLWEAGCTLWTPPPRPHAVALVLLWLDWGGEGRCTCQQARGGPKQPARPVCGQLRPLTEHRFIGSLRAVCFPANKAN